MCWCTLWMVYRCRLWQVIFLPPASPSTFEMHIEGSLYLRWRISMFWGRIIQNISMSEPKHHLLFLTVAIFMCYPTVSLFFSDFILFYFTILYWFCHTSTWIRHGCTRVPNPEPPFHLPLHTISLGHPSAPAPSSLYPALNLDWRFISYMILYMFQCHSPKSSHPLMRWMKLEPIIQSEVSQKEKHQYSILTHIYGV